MHPGRENVREAMQRQRGLMGEYPLSLCPEPDGDQVFVFPGREMDQAIDPTTNAVNTADLEIMMQERWRVARLGCFRGKDIRLIVRPNSGSFTRSWRSIH